MTALLVPLLAFAYATPAFADTLYTLEEDALVRTEITGDTGEVVARTVVGELGVASEVIGGMTQPVQGTIWATGGSHHRWLLRIDVNTGRATQVMNLGFQVETLAYDEEAGALYGTTASDWLVRIEPHNDDVNPLGSLRVAGSAITELVWVHGVGLVGRWQGEAGGRLGLLDSSSGELVRQTEFPTADGSRLRWSKEDRALYETHEGRIRAHRATDPEFTAFTVRTVHKEGLTTRR